MTGCAELVRIPQVTVFQSLLTETCPDAFQWDQAEVIGIDVSKKLSTTERTLLLRQAIRPGATILLPRAETTSSFFGTQIPQGTYLGIEELLNDQDTTSIHRLRKKIQDCEEAIKKISDAVEKLKSPSSSTKDWEEGFFLLLVLHKQEAHSSSLSSAEIVRQLLWCDNKDLKLKAQEYSSHGAQTVEKWKKNVETLHLELNRMERRADSDSLVEKIRSLSGRIVFFTSEYPESELKELFRKSIGLKSRSLSMVIIRA